MSATDEPRSDRARTGRGAALHPPVRRQVGGGQARRIVDRPAGARPSARAGYAPAAQRRRALHPGPRRRAASRCDAAAGRQGAANSKAGCALPTPRRWKSCAWCWSARSTAIWSRTINREAGDNPVAIGVAGEDAGLLTVRPLDSALGFVGSVTEVARVADRAPARRRTDAGGVDGRRRCQRPAPQRQRRRRRARDRRGAQGGETGLSDRRAGPARECRRPQFAGAADDPRRASRAPRIRDRSAPA